MIAQQPQARWIGEGTNPADVLAVDRLGGGLEKKHDEFAALAEFFVGQLAPRYFIRQLSICVRKLLSALLDPQFQPIVRFEQLLRDTLAFDDLGRKGSVGL